MHIYFTVTIEISNVYGNVFKNYEIINWIKYLKSETFTVLSKESIGLKSGLYLHVRYADFSQIVKEILIAYLLALWRHTIMTSQSLLYLNTKTSQCIVLVCEW